MSTIKDFKELTEIIETKSNISVDATDMLLELDVLPSVTTQAALNKWLVALGNRLKSNESIIINAIHNDKAATLDEYNSWLLDNFTSYSYNLYVETLGGVK